MADLVAEAVKFMRHDGLCGIVGGYGYCTCGMDKARDEIERLRASPLTTERREAAQVASFHAIYGTKADPFQNPEAFAFCSDVADAVLAALIAGPVSDGESA